MLIFFSKHWFYFLTFSLFFLVLLLAFGVWTGNRRNVRLLWQRKRQRFTSKNKWGEWRIKRGKGRNIADSTVTSELNLYSSIHNYICYLLFKNLFFMLCPLSEKRSCIQKLGKFGKTVNKNKKLYTNTSCHCHY